MRQNTNSNNNKILKRITTKYRIYRCNNRKCLNVNSLKYTLIKF